MGRVYTFNCPHCEYRAHVSGGTEEGYHCVTRTVICRDCKALHDISVRVRVTEGPAPAAGNARLLPTRKDALPPMLLFGRPPRTKWETFPLKCPASAHHKVEIWTKPGKCPRCGVMLEQDAMPYRIWD